jgi:hypothetical protein
MLTPGLVAGDRGRRLGLAGDDRADSRCGGELPRLPETVEDHLESLPSSSLQ